MNHLETAASLSVSKACIILAKPEHMSPMTLFSLSALFLVSILQSSQKTSDSGLFGSECVLKHFAQIECPHSSVNGIGIPVPGPHFKNSKQLRQDKVPDTASV